MKKNKLTSTLFILVLFICFSCQTSNESTVKELFIASDFTDSLFNGGIEGPAVDKAGNLYAVSFQKDGTIGIIDAKGNGQLFVNLPQGSVGNGIRFNSKGEMLVADYAGHNVLKIDPVSKQVSVYAHDSTMNQPNDVARMKNDIVFCSDPKWSDNTGKLWMVDQGGKTHLLEDSMGTTNGVEVGTGDTVLYVNESIQRNVWAYSLKADGSVSNKRLFYHFEDGGLDGMRCDVEGNLYITRYDKGMVVILSPTGKLLREVNLKGKKPTNITFGGKEGNACFVTLQDRGVIEVFQNDKKGRE